eukprot:Anaeramoba_flamelloidesa1054247_18.p1 GENE.a1054247_18~~a1054247_18.p1  ORF type:complete len:271 (-),score=64.33 a1054247_18:12-824(-)
MSVAISRQENFSQDKAFKNTKKNHSKKTRKRKHGGKGKKTNKKHKKQKEKTHTSQNKKNKKSKNKILKSGSKEKTTNTSDSEIRNDLPLYRQRKFHPVSKSKKHNKEISKKMISVSVQNDKKKKLKKKSKKNEATMNKALDLKSQTSPEISNKIKKEIHSNDPLEKIQRKAEFQSGALPPQSIEKMSIKLEKLLKKYFFSITSRLILPSLVTTNSIERKIQIPSPSMFSYRTQPLQTYQEGSINRDQARHESYNLINQSTIQERSTLGQH